jgi:sedoheptulose-bisphosphatase
MHAMPQMGDSLAEFLIDATPDPKLRQLMMSMAEAVRTIAFKVRVNSAYACCITRLQ